ncbi:hypothetical protein QVD17_37638 [Tagetes erecta]|uniref:NADP-dependent oxidoreductase domain-containing protein n=1 Tax=Tagetes erecta TaxID=13708 RepID=A0AAD8NIJ3_TARER|nr:hypothetical protein QVD17_37638 [Tagetes erecta]
MEVSALGLGCMSLTTSGYGPGKPEEDMIKLIHHAVNSGVTHLDTSDMYGSHANEILIGKALKGLERGSVQLATKFGIKSIVGDCDIHGDPEYVRACCEASLKRLGVDYIDLYYINRVDSRVPIEITVITGEASKGRGRVTAPHFFPSEVLERRERSRDCELAKRVKIVYSVNIQSYEVDNTYVHDQPNVDKTATMLGKGPDFRAVSYQGYNMLISSLLKTRYLYAIGRKKVTSRVPPLSITTNIGLWHHVYSGNIGYCVIMVMHDIVISNRDHILVNKHIMWRPRMNERLRLRL